MVRSDGSTLWLCELCASGWKCVVCDVRAIKWRRVGAATIRLLWTHWNAQVWDETTWDWHSRALIRLRIYNWFSIDWSSDWYFTYAFVQNETRFCSHFVSRLEKLAKLPIDVRLWSRGVGQFGIGNFVFSFSFSFQDVFSFLPDGYRTLIDSVITFLIELRCVSIGLKPNRITRYNMMNTHP